MQSDFAHMNALNWLCGEAPPVKVLLIRPAPGAGPDVLALMESDPRAAYSVRVVSRIEEALNGQPPAAQVIFLDQVLAGSQGEGIRHVRDATGLPVITVGGKDTPERLCRAVTAGAVDDIPGNLLSPALIRRSVRYAIEFNAADTCNLELKQMQENFVAHISHELRTPLNSILGFTQLLLEGNVPEPEIQTEFLGIVQNQGQLLSRLIDNLLDASLLNPEIYRSEKAPCRPENIIRQALEAAKEAAAAKEVTLRSEITGTLPELQADAVRLSQAVANLLLNAIKFSDAGTEVWVRASADVRQVTISVTDQGIGIPADAIPFLFDRFYAAGDRYHQAGTGMGLYLSRAIVDTHQGNVWVESDGEGKGSTFYITLPLEPENQE